MPFLFQLLLQIYFVNSFCETDSYPIQGHHGDVRSLAVSPCGHYLASSSSDFSLRLWERTDGIVIPDDEREQVFS